MSGGNVLNQNRIFPKLNHHVCFKPATLVGVQCPGIAEEGVGRGRIEKQLHWEKMDVFGRDTGTYSFVAQLSPIKGMKNFLGFLT